MRSGVTGCHLVPDWSIRRGDWSIPGDSVDVRPGSINALLAENWRGRHDVDPRIVGFSGMADREDIGSRATLAEPPAAGDEKPAPQPWRWQ